MTGKWVGGWIGGKDWWLYSHDEMMVGATKRLRHHVDQDDG